MHVVPVEYFLLVGFPFLHIVVSKMEQFAVTTFQDCLQASRGAESYSSTLEILGLLSVKSIKNKDNNPILGPFFTQNHGILYTESQNVMGWKGY